MRDQIGFIRNGGTEVDPITRDTNRYAALTLSADGRTMATVLSKSSATISVLSKVHGRSVNLDKSCLSPMIIWDR